MTEEQEVLVKELDKFKLDYYKNMDITYWFDKVSHLHNKFERLKDREKQGRVVFELYSIYLQLAETLFININAVSLSTNRFPGAIFIENKDLRTLVNDKFFKKTKFSTWFIDNYIFAIQKTSPTYKERYDQYTNLMQETAKNYLDNYQLLNAYKHGSRVVAKHGKNSISLVDKQGKSHVLIEADCEITYFSKERLKDANDPKLEDKPAVFRRKISFKIQRLFGQCAFIITVLQNLRITVLHTLGVVDKEGVLEVYIDEEKWKDSFGDFSFKEPLFSFNEKKRGIS